MENATVWDIIKVGLYVGLAFIFVSLVLPTVYFLLLS